MLPLDTFDYPAGRKVSTFEPSVLSSLAGPYMAGSAIKLKPEEVRDAIRNPNPSRTELTYLAGLIQQLDAIEFNQFRCSCGASIYELARAFEKTNINAIYAVRYMNKYSSVADPDIDRLPKIIYSRSLHHPFCPERQWDGLASKLRPN